jgi:hypothetical protein
MGYTQELSVLNTLKNAIEIAYNENLSLDLTVFEDLAFDLQQDINAQIEQDEKDAHFDFQEEADRAYFQILRYRRTLQEFLGRNY